MKVDTIPVAQVNGVYFPGQKLRFKINDPGRKFFFDKEGFFGIVSKRTDVLSDLKD